MVNRKKQTLLIVSGVLILAIALGVSAVFAATESLSAGQVEARPLAQPALQDGDDDQDEPEVGDPDDEDQTLPHAPFGMRPGSEHGFAGRGGFHSRGFGGQLEGQMPMEEVLAESLGVTVEQLQEAHTLVFEALTEESDGDFRGRRGFARGDEFNALLAQALSDVSGKEITVEALAAAHEAAREAMLEQLPEAFAPSEEQLALMEAHQALQGAIDRELLFLEAVESLGIDPVAAQESLADRQSLFALFEEAGVTTEEFMAAQKEAYENAVQNAVPEFITQEQAELILEGDFGGPGFGGPSGGKRGHGGPGGCPAGAGVDGQPGFHGRHGGFGSGNGNAPTSGVSL